MGSQISMQASENIQEQVSETINDIMNNINNEISSKSQSKQTIVIEMGDNATIKGGQFTISQKANVQMSAIINSDSSLVADVSSEIESSLGVENMIESQQAQSGIILGQSQMSMQASLIKQSFHDKIEQNVKNAISSVVNQEASSENEIIVIIGDNFSILEGGELIIDQSSIIDAISENLASSMVKSMIDSSIITTAVASTTMSSTQTQEGISGWEAALMMLVAMLPFLGGGYMVMKSAQNAISLLPYIIMLLISVALIVLGVQSILQYNNAIYFVCANDPNSDNYINTELDENGEGDIYINPDFLNIPEKTCGDLGPEECVPFPEGHGDPTIAYLLSAKQDEFNAIQAKLDEDKADIDKINKDLEALSSNKNNWVCANGSDPFNDPSKSDTDVMGFISAGSWSITYSGIMIAIGFLLMILSIFLLSMSGSSDVSAPVGGGGVGGEEGRGGKTEHLQKMSIGFLKI